MKRVLIYYTIVLLVTSLVSCSGNKNMPSQPYQVQVTTQNSTEDSETIAIKKQIERIKLQHEYDSIVLANAFEDPCYVEDDDEYFREYGISIDIDKANAQSMSIDVAIENLKKHIGEIIRSLSVSYSELYPGPMPSDEIQRKIERRLVSTIDGFLLNYKKKICQKWNKDKRGNYVYYTAFEASKEHLKQEIIGDLDQLSKKEQLGLDVNNHRNVIDDSFRKIQKRKKEKFE